MIILFNVFCIALMAFDVISFGVFTYLYWHEDRWPDLQKWILVCTGIMTVGSLVVIVVLSVAQVTATEGIDVVPLATAWVMFLSMAFSQAIIWGCLRDDLKNHDYAMLLSVFMYFVCAYSSIDLILKVYLLGYGMVATYWPADILVNMISIFGMLILWHYVRLVGNLNSRWFHFVTIVNYLVAVLGFLIYLTAPITGLITASPEVSGTVYADWYFYTMWCQYFIMIVILIAVTRAHMNAIEKIILISLMVFVIVFEGYINFMDGVYITPLIMAIGGMGCYQGVVVRRAEQMERHLVQVDMASTIQQGMLPQKFPKDPRFSIHAHMWPAKEVAGDFYDFYQPDPDTLYLTIADVSGKDVPAAMFMARAHALIREHEKAGLSPDEIFNRVNYSLAQGNSEKLFVTAWMGRFNLSRGILTYANAGHNPPIVTRVGVGSYYLRSKPSLMLGIRKKTHYDRKSTLLKRGDRIILYTDGVTEAIDTHEEQFGEDRLLNYANDTQKCNDEERTERLFAEVNSFAEGMEQFDDVTVLCGTYVGDEMTIASGFAEEVYPAKTKYLDKVTAFIEEAAMSMGYPEDHLFKLEMSIEELFANVCNYAYIASEERGFVRVTVMAVEDEIQILFADMGVPFNPLMQEPPNLQERNRKRTVGGLGIHLVRKFMDDVRYENTEGENRLTIVKKIER